MTGLFQAHVEVEGRVLDLVILKQISAIVFVVRLYARGAA